MCKVPLLAQLKLRCTYRAVGGGTVRKEGFMRQQAFTSTVDEPFFWQTPLTSCTKQSCLENIVTIRPAVWMPLSVEGETTKSSFGLRRSEKSGRPGQKHNYKNQYTSLNQAKQHDITYGKVPQHFLSYTLWHSCSLVCFSGTCCCLRQCALLTSLTVTVNFKWN